MPVYVLEESDYAGPIPQDTILPARVTAVAEKKKPWQNDDGSDVTKIEFSFVVEDPDSAWDGTRLWGETSTKFVTHPECRLRAWAQEILVAELPPGFALDTDSLVGNHCRVVVALREYEKDGQTKQRNYVHDVIRSRDGHVFGAVDEDAPF